LAQLAHLIEKNEFFTIQKNASDCVIRRYKFSKNSVFYSYPPAHLVDFQPQIPRLRGHKLHSFLRLRSGQVFWDFFGRRGRRDGGKGYIFVYFSLAHLTLIGIIKLPFMVFLGGGFDV
jgi:hypothetical protein